MLKLEHLSCGERLRVLGLCSPEKSSLRGNINAYKYLKAECHEQTSLSSVVPCDRTRGNEYKLQLKKVHLNMRIKFFAVRMLEP